MIFHLQKYPQPYNFADQYKTEVIAQQVRAPDCGSGGRGFEPH